MVERTLTGGEVSARAAAAWSRTDTIAAVAVFVATALLYTLVFNRETTLSYSIGYNLYGAERVLEGQLPYRDFHTLYPPATVYLNAALFKFGGVYLITALAGVLVFKILAILVVYCCARSVMPLKVALTAWLMSLLWLRPNGPFKAVPMHYGALFLAIGLFCLLRFDANRQRGVKSTGLIVVSGLSLGVLALFKHNIAAYALFGAIALLLLETGPERLRLDWRITRVMPPVLRLLFGFAVVVTPVIAYFAIRRATGDMARSLLFGPGEFLASRLAVAPSPLGALIFLIVMILVVIAGRMAKAGFTSIIWLVFAAAVTLRMILRTQPSDDGILFYTPAAMFIAAMISVFHKRLLEPARRWPILTIAVFAAAAAMESFPRFAREQIIGAMPFVVILLFALLYELKPRIAAFVGRGIPTMAALAVIPLVLGVIAVRLLEQTYVAGFGLRSNTGVAVERARGVYFPAADAEEIDGVVSHIQRRVPEGGSFFAQSYGGSSYLFLADRRSPSGAQFWGGAGVSEEEQARTLRALDENLVSLVVTTRRELAAERYFPMREYLSRNFVETRSIGDVVILERKETSYIRQ